MKLMQRAEVLLASGVLVAFFQPWAKVFFFSGSGYDVGVHLDGTASSSG